MMFGVGFHRPAMKEDSCAQHAWSERRTERALSAGRFFAAARFSLTKADYLGGAIQVSIDLNPLFPGEPFI